MDKTLVGTRNQQEQLSGGVLYVRFFEKLHKIHRKIPVLESFFNEALRPATLLKKDSCKSVFL